MDGFCEADFQIVHTTNSIQDIESSVAESDFSVMKLVRRGVPISLLEKRPKYSYKYERSVNHAIANGFGLHSHSAVQKIAEKICEDNFRNLTNPN